MVINMNEILQQIVVKHGITEMFINAKKMDKENRIFISENYVIKIYYPRKFQYFYNELEVYQKLNQKDYLPKLYNYVEEENYKYIIISRLNGKSLFDSCNEYSNVERIKFIEQISNILREINNIRQENINFKLILDMKFQNALNSLNFSEGFKNDLQKIYNCYINYVHESEMGKLIHIDIHFYNFFVNCGKVFAYDFENTTIAPLDYQLLRWYRMWKYPETFIYPKYSLTLPQKKSYEILFPQMLRFYPELSNHENFDERLKLYLLIYLLEEANRCHLSQETVRDYISQNKRVRIGGKL